MAEAEKFVLALDQGTTSSRALLYSSSGTEIASHSIPLDVRFPEDGWVEQDPEEIWGSLLAAMEKTVADVDAGTIAAIGITNQRETTVVWDRESGRALAPAVVWQCRRSESICRELRSAHLGEELSEKTGLVVDAYFSATKMAWLLRNVDGLASKVQSGSAVFGTVDSWVIYRLSREAGRAAFVTDPSNASRTMLCSLDGRWDQSLLAHFGIPGHALCSIHPSAGRFAATKIRGVEIPITGVLGDQQASLLGHGCIEPDTLKCTFGTGAFLLVNTGSSLKRSTSGMLSTIAWGMPGNGQCELTYALEGSIFVAGSLVQWLRDKMGLIATAAESEAVARSVDDSGGVIIVPAFVGLGAPHWRADVRGAMFGLTRDTGRGQLVRAALEGIAHQVADVLEAPELRGIKRLRVDGGMSANSLFCQILADLTCRDVDASASVELTARGAGMIAAVGCGICSSLGAARAQWGVGETKSYTPVMSPADARSARIKWRTAIEQLVGRA